MNYTFLPQTERNKLKKEYRVRALVVLLFVLSVSVLMGVVSLFPTYINSRIVEKQELAKIADINKTNDSNGLEAVKKQLDADNVFLVNAETTNTASTFYPIIKDIIIAKGSVKINSIAITNVSTTTIDFVIQGFSTNREGLIGYKNRLETSMSGSVADLPLSDLAKNRDIQFSLKFTYSI